MSKAVFFHIGDSYHLTLAEMAVDTANRAGMDTVMITDMKTPEIEGIDTVIRYEGLVPEPMVANVDAQYRYLIHESEDEHVWFLDTDVLVRRDPTEHLKFKRETLLDITYRWGNALFDAMPFNYGVIHVKPTLKASAFWQHLLREVKSLPLEKRLWYGNQVAMKNLLPQPGTKPDPNWFMEVEAGSNTEGRVTYGIMPLIEFNHSPEDPDDICSRAHILHYKGRRKEFMRQHYEEHFRG